MRIQSVESNIQNMYLPRKFLPLVRCILQRPPFFARKNGRIGTASDSLILVTYALISNVVENTHMIIICTESRVNLKSMSLHNRSI